MNMIAVDIGNTNITLGLFLENKEKNIKTIPGTCERELTEYFKTTWKKIPVARSSKEKKREGVIVVSSVKPQWTKLVEKIATEQLGEKIYLVGKDIPYPMDLSFDQKSEVGSDRIVSAAAAYAAVEKAVVIADFGTAVTIDLVDDRGVFVGGIICPGFEISAQTLKENTVQLPKVTVTRPENPFGRTTTEAINCGLYYSAIGILQEIIRRYAEVIGTWPQTVITGSAAKIIKEDSDFIDSHVPNLVIKGLALAWQKYIEEKIE